MIQNNIAVLKNNRQDTGRKPCLTYYVLVMRKQPQLSGSYKVASAFKKRG
jgi:hypothetical protein